MDNERMRNLQQQIDELHRKGRAASGEEAVLAFTRLATELQKERTMLMQFGEKLKIRISYICSCSMYSCSYSAAASAVHVVVHVCTCVL